MTTMSVWPLTDDRGRWLLPTDAPEPEPGSVVLTNGIHGTAWQRHFKDGWWYCAGRVAPVRWDSLIRNRNLVLVYDAPVRVEPNPEARR